MKRVSWILGVLIIMGYLLTTCLVVVKENEAAVIMQFGKPVRTITQAGLTVKLPAPIQTKVFMDKRMQLLKLPASEYVTSDRRNLVIQSFALWRISKPELFLGSLRNLEVAQSRLTDLVTSNIGAAIGHATLSGIFSTRPDKSSLRSIFEEITANSAPVALQDYGIEVLAIRPNRFGFPRQNVQAIYDRMIAEQKRIAARYRAEGTEEAEKIKAESEREVRELLAKAHRESQTMLGDGEARATEIFTEAYAQDPEYYQFRKSMDLYKDMMGNDTTLVLSSESPLVQRLLESPGASDAYAK
ncbi:protease modulator HflC [Oleiphilus sp. HI0061]|uniref:protease modulator HflC n=2 Tax=Oleiphilus sp. HI0061 TaxID=1822239 RepID=UPI0012E83FEE|nr:protease modulator HflC [Oleiphilus sp. HI0061]